MGRNYPSHQISITTFTFATNETKAKFQCKFFPYDIRLTDLKDFHDENSKLQEIFAKNKAIKGFASINQNKSLAQHSFAKRLKTCTVMKLNRKKISYKRLPSGRKNEQMNGKIKKCKKGLEPFLNLR